DHALGSPRELELPPDVGHSLPAEKRVGHYRRMLAIILAFMTHQWSRDRFSVILFEPHTLWVSFASALNAGLVLLNP
ncbi:hypothetical protein ABTK18_19330, partial [Acinetobacter baumannii]